MLTPEIKTKINQLWDKFWSNSISTRYNVIEQISYLIFIRWLEDTNSTKRQRLLEASLPFISLYEGEFTPASGTPVPLRMMRWSYLRQMTDKQELLEHVATSVFPWLKTLPPADYPFSRQMADATFLIPNALLLDEAIRLMDNIAEDIELQTNDVPELQDTLGDVYGYLLHDISDTTTDAAPSVPIHFIDLMVELARPTLDDLICDPFCGTGDMLVCAAQRVLKDHTSKPYFYTDENGFEKGVRADLITSEDKRLRFERDMFTGMDKDAGQLRLATMNLMVHGVDRPLTTGDNTQPAATTLVISALGLTEEPGVLDKIVGILAPGGRAVLLVSSALLSDDSPGASRKALLDNCDLQAVIHLPPSAAPLYTMGKSAILVFRKKAPSNTPAHHGRVWSYQMTTDGYSYTPDGPKTKLPVNPLPDIALAFHTRDTSEKVGALGDQIWWTSLSDIRNSQYDLGIKNYQALTSGQETLESFVVEEPRFTYGSAKTLTPVEVVEFIQLTYGNNPFTFRELQTAMFMQDDTMTFEKVHQEIWSMLKADTPILRQAYYDARMARIYPAAYQFLRNKKADNGIYLLYTASIPNQIHETAIL